jgi:2-polyprenyl-6-methoxyphenol hydroxylase-like FAD-dependent oxidoreductase
MSVADSYDLVIVGGGIGGGALATVMARAGKSVLVLEKTSEYRDIVRGEWIAPWGVAEAIDLGLLDSFLAAGGHYITRHVEYGDNIDPAEAEQNPLNLGFLPGIPGPLAIGHPPACNALNATAVASGATVLRGVDDVQVSPGARPCVTFTHEGAAREVRARLVIAADGRNSTVRRQLGFELEPDEPHHWFSGLLVEGAHAWPADLETMGTFGDTQLFVFPQGGGRLRLYLSWPLEQKDRLAGANAERAFLDAFRVCGLPHAEAIADAIPAGPANAFPNQDVHVPNPVASGVVLIGDAAGHNDPIIGQGLSITLRDVRIVRDILVADDDWPLAAIAPYVEERRERMRRLRLCARLDSIIHAEFGPEAQRRRDAIRARRAADPMFMAGQGAVMLGPEKLPPAFFEDGILEEVRALA